MTELDSLPGTRAAYDAVAVRYAQQFADTLRDRPVERALLAAFAESVRTGGGGEVADLGCGPGHITAHLRELGLRAFGVDASPAMVELARRANPGVRFEVGSMAALDLADGALGGVLSRASLIHVPPPELPAVLAEFARVLAPGGRLLIGCLATDDPAVPAQPYDHSVVTAYRLSPDHLAGLLRGVGVHEVARVLCEPKPTDKRQFRELLLLAAKEPVH
ncbi:methyltransferase domain-containing protein [Kitasatospora sp. YST-16]|uniref:class I SAM-dependent methyltransferase n=1 Tax=Kitasatospora sp. YST-16 TaxID=2998080 RepID=UPI002283A722|nr:class I SAM-dependent methyltransferase [Kitasatospora sp. YST-16]WAL75300.1 methyltransferase domain-containing protein [Kitasatospora sp. YST-16]WNW41360.1 methyltransferase domain-containing protein [Streptomyces sp. Li-HN-5-13]